jgi:pimeloyl-ACP methyl ester carboxylesterase
MDNSTLAPQAGVEKVYKAFFTPSKYEAKTADQAILASGDSYSVPFEEGQLAATSWGTSGPAILLMHGWGGSRAQMTGFVRPLLDAGLRVVAYDQPAHGESAGSQTNLLKIIPTMRLVAQKAGPFDGIIAHSFGTLISSYALTTGQIDLPGHLVYFGALNRLLDTIPRFQAQARVPDALINGFQAMLSQEFGPGRLESIVNEELVQHIPVPALMFHDSADNVTPVEDSRAIARAWKTARLIETDGLGHRGALQSESVHAQVAKFLGGA